MAGENHFARYHVMGTENACLSLFNLILTGSVPYRKGKEGIGANSKIKISE